MEQEKKIFLKNFIWNILGTGLNSFNSLFFLIIVTRINGVNDAGIFSICYATALILYTVGLYSGRLCQVTDIEKKIKDKDYILNRVISCVIMMILAVGFVFIKGYTAYKLSVCLLLCLYKATEAFAEILYGIMQKNELLYKSGQSLTIKSLAGLIIFLIVDFITKNLIIAILSAVIVNILTMLTFDFIIIKKLVSKDEKITLSNVIKVFKTDFFVFANSFAGIYVLNAPKYAIDSYLTEDMQAMFGYIIMPATVITLFTQFIFMPCLNKLTEFYENKNMKDFKGLALKIKACVLGFGVLATGAAYLLGPEVLKIIYGVDELLNYRINLCIIIASHIFYAISYINLVLLTTTRNTFVQFVIYVITMIVAFIGSNVLVKTNGINGVTLSCTVTLFTQFILYVIITKVIFHKIEKRFEEEKIQNT